MLSPLRFHYDAETFTLPVRLGLVNSSGTQDLIVHILAQGTALRGRELPERHDPDEPRRRRERARAVRRVLRGALRPHAREEPEGGRHRVRVGRGDVRSVPRAARSTASDLATLGADVLAVGDRLDRRRRLRAARRAGSAAPRRRTARARAAPRGRVFMPSGFVLTRLHARYAKDVARRGPRVPRGAANRRRSRDPLRREGARARRDPSSAQQLPGPLRDPPPVGRTRSRARTPSAACGADLRPDRSPTAGGGPKPALGLAFVARDAKLPAFVVGEIPELGVKGEGAPVSATVPKTSPSGAASDETTAPSPDTPEKAGKRDKRGCLGCASSTVPETVGDGALLLVVGLALRRPDRTSAEAGREGASALRSRPLERLQGAFRGRERAGRNGGDATGRPGRLAAADPSIDEDGGARQAAGPATGPASGPVAAVGGSRGTRGGAGARSGSERRAVPSSLPSFEGPLDLLLHLSSSTSSTSSTSRSASSPRSTSSTSP